MATNFKTQTGNGEYRLQFETNNQKYFLIMQEVARLCVDLDDRERENELKENLSILSRHLFK